jgi:hypothetical protein
MKQLNPTQAAGRRYLAQLFVLMVVYVAVLFGAIAIVNAMHPTGALRYAILLVPLVPVVLLVPAILRYFVETDEFERRVMTESLAIAAAVTALLAVTYGFLEVAGLPRPSAWMTWIVLMGAWAVARFLVTRHYQR